MAKAIEQLHPLGQHIRKFRKDNRYSLSQLAEVMGMSKVQLWEIETNPNPNPRLKTLMAIAKGTNAALSRIAILAAQSNHQQNAAQGGGIER